MKVWQKAVRTVINRRPVTPAHLRPRFARDVDIPSLTMISK